MTFEQWWQKCNPNANAEVHRDTEYYKVAAAAWNDSRQMALAAVFLRYNALRKRLLAASVSPEVGRAVTEFLIELSEMT